MATAPALTTQGSSHDRPSAPSKQSRQRLWIALIVVLLLAAAAGAAWCLLRPASGVPTPVKPVPPVFVELDTFTVNLAEDRILQTALTLQVGKAADADQLKLYLPQVKNRLLMLLSSRTADELQTTDGKERLRTDIVARLREPFDKDLDAPAIHGVFLTSFVIQ